MRRLWAALLLVAILLWLILSAAPVVLARQPPPGIAREGTIELLVADTDDAIADIERLVARMGGTLEASERWSEMRFGISRPYATLVVSLPNIQLESTIQSLRSLALDVLEQNIASRDTGPEYADLTSRRSYLESQRTRLEDLLELATNDAERNQLETELSVINAELTRVEEQLNTLWWAQHDTKLTIHLKPLISTPLPTLTRTLRPTTTPQPWDPTNTYWSAIDFLIELFEFTPIWYYLCCAGSIILGATGILLLVARRKKG